MVENNNVKFLDLVGLTHFLEKTKTYIADEMKKKVDKTFKINEIAMTGDHITLTGDDLDTGSSTHPGKINFILDDIYVKIGQAAASGVTKFGSKTGDIDIKSGSIVNGTVNFSMGGTNGKELNGTVYGLKSAAYTESGEYVPITRTVNAKQLNKDIVLAGKDILVGGDNVNYGKQDLQVTIESLDKRVTSTEENSGVISIGGQKGKIKIDNTASTIGNVKFSISDDKVVRGTLPELTEKLNEKAFKKEALKTVMGTADGGGSKATITIHSTKVDTSVNVPNTTFDLPTAGDDTHGTITLNQVKQIAETATTSVYRVKGTKSSINEVLKITNAIVGDVWNVAAAFELKGKKYPEGTNVVCTVDTTASTGNENKWDPLGGTVDLSPYAKDNNVVHSFGGQKDEITIDGVAGKGGKVVFVMAGKKLTGNVDLSDYTPTKGVVTSFGEKHGDITINTSNKANGITFSMNNNELTAKIETVSDPEIDDLFN